MVKRIQNNIWRYRHIVKVSNKDSCKPETSSQGISIDDENCDKGGEMFCAQQMKFSLDVDYFQI